MSPPPFLSYLLLGLHLCLTAEAGLAQGTPPGRDAATVERELRQAAGAARVPLLVELAYQSQGEPTQALEFADDALKELAHAPSVPLEIRAPGRAE